MAPGDGFEINRRDKNFFFEFFVLRDFFVVCCFCKTPYGTRKQSKKKKSTEEIEGSESRE
jgi:hypothetical protein